LRKDLIIFQVIWGGQGLIYSASEDRTIKVWNPEGQFIRDLKGHGHWVNSLCLHTDYALRFEELYRKRLIL